MKGHAIYIMVAYFVGQILGHVYVFTKNYLKIPVAIAALYFLIKNHKVIFSFFQGI
jgi:hypothetical protein